MKVLGILLIMLFFSIGIISEHLPDCCDPRPLIGLAFAYFLIGIWVLIIDNDLINRKKSNKNSEPVIIKKSDLEKYNQSFNEACKQLAYPIGMPPAISKESHRLSLENQQKGVEVYKKLKDKYNGKPDFPQDRITRT